MILLGPLGETLQEFTFDDAAPWPISPDGGGRTLVIIDPLGEETDAANWRTSYYNGGSPGPRRPPDTGRFSHRRHRRQRGLRCVEVGIWHRVPRWPRRGRQWRRLRRPRRLYGVTTTSARRISLPAHGAGAGALAAFVENDTPIAPAQTSRDLAFTLLNAEPVVDRTPHALYLLFTSSIALLDDDLLLALRPAQFKPFVESHERSCRLHGDESEGAGNAAEIKTQLKIRMDRM